MSINDSVTISRSCNDNLTRLYLGDRITIWFSYETPIAFAISAIQTSGANASKIKPLATIITHRHSAAMMWTACRDCIEFILIDVGSDHVI